MRFQTRSSLPDEHQNQNPVHSRACLPSSHLRFFRSGPNNLPAYYSRGSKLQGHHPETPGSCWCRLPLPFLWLRSHHNSCSVARSHQFCSDTSFVAVHPHFTIPCQKECQNPRKATFFRFFPGILNNFSITRARFRKVGFWLYQVHFSGFGVHKFRCFHCVFLSAQWIAVKLMSRVFGYLSSGSFRC